MALAQPIPPSDDYHLSLLEMGVPSVIAFHASLPATTPLHDLSILNLERVALHLLNKYPLLRCSIARTPGQRACLLMQPDMHPSAVVAERRDATEMKASEHLARMLNEVEIDWEQGPLWRVWSCSSTSNGKPAIVLGIAHLISDGVGARALFSDLLHLLRNYPTCPPPPSYEFPPVRDDMQCFLPPKEKVTEFQREMNKLGPVKPPPPIIPSTVGAPDSAKYTETRQLGSFSASAIAKLKSAGRKHAVRSLHPILQTAALVAISLVYVKDSQSEFDINSHTDVSLRDPKLGHPRATGSFAIGMGTKRYVCTTSDCHFWRICRMYQQDLRDQDEMKETCWGLGFDWGRGEGNEGGYSLDQRMERDEQRKTLAGGWSWQSTASTSNLGVMERTGWEGELKDVCWAQTARDGSDAFPINVSPTRRAR